MVLWMRSILCPLFFFVVYSYNCVPFGIKYANILYFQILYILFFCCIVLYLIHKRRVVELESMGFIMMNVYQFFRWGFANFLPILLLYFIVGFIVGRILRLRIQCITEITESVKGHLEFLSIFSGWFLSIEFHISSIFVDGIKIKCCRKCK